MMSKRETAFTATPPQQGTKLLVREEVILSGHARKFGINTVIRAYLALTGQRFEDLAGPSKVPGLCLHRHQLAYVLRQVTNASYSLIGRHLGQRDMATIHASVAKTTEHIDLDPAYAEAMAALVEKVRALAPAHAAEVMAKAQPWQFLAARQVLRDPEVADADARKTALTLLNQLEASHG